MSFASLSGALGAQSASLLIPQCAIAVNNAPFPPLLTAQIQEIVITETADPPTQFTIRFVDSEQHFTGSKPPLIGEGSKVKISLGYVNQLTPLLTGEVTAITAEFPEVGALSYQVEGFDLSHRLSRGTAYRVFGKPGPEDALTDSDIVRQLAQEVGLQPVVGPTPVRAHARVQRHVTNRKMLDMLAQANNFSFWVDGEILYFQQSPRRAGSVSLAWGESLIRFNARLSTAGQVEAVVVHGWDAKQKLAFTGRASRSSGITRFLAPSGANMVSLGANGSSERGMADTGATSQQEATQLASSVLHAQERGFLTGSGATVGTPAIRVGASLTLTKLGRFSGAYTVTRATHTYNLNGYQTSFEASYGG